MNVTETKNIAEYGGLVIQEVFTRRTFSCPAEKSGYMIWNKDSREYVKDAAGKEQVFLTMEDATGYAETELEIDF